MSSKTKIIVLHMKEIIYTIIFALLAILFIVLLTIMFHADEQQATDSEPRYIPGIYTSSVSLSNAELEIEVFVDSNHINAIRFTNLSDSIETMYPLMQPTIEYIAEQIYENQSTKNIQFSSDNPYTSQVLTYAIEDAIKKAIQHE